MKFWLLSDRDSKDDDRCFFCRTDQSVKYAAVRKATGHMIKICNRCALLNSDFLKDIDEAKIKKN